MSTCISMHGEYSEHTPDEDGNFSCTRCGWLDEDTLIDQARRAREAEAAIKRVRSICDEYTDSPPPSEPEVCDDADEGYCHYDAHRAVADRIRRAIDEPEVETP